MSFDDVLEQIGGFGAYQKWIFFLTFLPNIMAGLVLLSPVFLLGTPRHRCAIRGYDNDTYTPHSGFHQTLVNRSIPLSVTDPDEFDCCYMYNPDNVSYTDDNVTLSKVKCDRWVYDHTIFKDSFVSKLDLVCDKKLWVSNAEMLFYFGTLIGSLISGILADRYGRKLVMYTNSLLLLGSSFGLVWTQNYIVLVTLQFIYAGSTVGTFLPVYSISLEITGVEGRVWPGVASNFPYVIGVLIYAAITYGFKSVFSIQLTTTLIGLPLISYWWITSALAYFGLSLNVGNIHGDLYLNFALVGLAEIPAYVVLTCILDRIGRRSLYLISMTIGGVSCVSNFLVVEFAQNIPVLQVILAMIGKLGVSAGYGVMYVYSAEIFPTKQRNAGLGLGYVFSGLGTMAAPYIISFSKHIGGTFGNALPLCIIGILVFLSALLTLLLPETLNKHLPETVKDGEKVGQLVQENTYVFDSDRST